MCVVSSRWSCPTWAGRDTTRLLRWRRGRGRRQGRCRTSSALTEGGRSLPAATKITQNQFSYILSWFYLPQVVFVCSADKNVMNLNVIWCKVQTCSREEVTPFCFLLLALQGRITAVSLNECFCPLTVVGGSLTVLASTLMHSWPSLVLSSMPDTHTHTHTFLIS